MTFHLHFSSNCTLFHIPSCIALFNWSVSILVATLSMFQYVFAFMSDSVHVRVTFQVPPQVVQTGVGLGTDLAVVRSHP